MLSAKNNMKKYYAITISNHFGSKHFFVKSTIKRTVILSCVAVIAVIAASVAANVFQHNNINELVSEQSKLNQELVQYDRLNSKLNQIISNHESQIEAISKELVEIERFSGVDTGDSELSLQERIDVIGHFYNAKEEKYSVIGNRVELIEDAIGLTDNDELEASHDLSSRVELASLTAGQARILYDNVPSGYPSGNAVAITSGFGMRKHPVTKINSFHKGIDLRAKVGEKIYATADGFVSAADYSELSGNRIIILHNFGFETRYSHLKEMTVNPGDVVHKGDLIGYSGNTGRSSAPHIHYEIRYLGKAINPYEFIKWEFGTNDIFTQVRGIKWPSLISLINKQIIHQTLQLSLADPTSLGE